MYKKWGAGGWDKNTTPKASFLGKVKTRHTSQSLVRNNVFLSVDRFLTLFFWLLINSIDFVHLDKSLEMRKICNICLSVIDLDHST